MDRRSFLAATAVTLALPLKAAAQMIEYREGLVSQRLAAGETVFVDFSASWCSTCRTQGRAIEAVRAENPAYDREITFIKVDWDSHRRGRLVADLGIPRRSTLVVLKGNQELGRLVANTSKDAIKSLMDTALAAA